MYNNLGQRTGLIDPRGNSTVYAYDAAGQVISVTDTLGGVVSFAYDAGGRLTGLTNANGKTTSFTYNALGNVLTRTDPLNRTYTNSYDQYGRLTSRTDARGVSVSYSYDTLIRVTAVTYPTGVNSYSYDTLGRLASVTDPTGTTSYAFDVLSRITGITTPQGTVGYTYNDANQRTSMSLPGSRSVSYNDDTTGRLASLTDWTSGAINYSFDADGQLTGLSRSNGVTSAYGYDAAGRLTTISHDGSGGNLLFTNYTLDANGNRIGMASNAGTESYTLDALNRLTNATYPNGDTAAYSYDANGNRLSQTFNGATTNYTYDNAGQLLSDGTTTYGYDANGNLTSAGADTYTWDWANRMTGATVGGNSASYAYDAFDVRVSGTVSGTSSSYLWDRLAPYPTLVDDGVYGYLHGVGPQAQIDGSGNRSYLLSDALASIRGVTDGSGALVGSTTYDAFGTLRSQTGTGSAFGYTGEWYTAATGLLHLRARDLNPTLGRFLSVDTVQPNAPGSQGFNLYAYVANNPTMWVDPSGHGLDGYGGTLAFLPSVSPMTAVMAGSLSALIALTLALGRQPLSWTDRRMIYLALTTYALVLACGLTPGCMAAMRSMGDAAVQLGSEAADGVIDWSTDTLQDAVDAFPVIPDEVIARPMPDILGVPWVVGPDSQPDGSDPDGDPGSDGPQWGWGKIGALIGLGALLGTLLSSSGPLPSPQPNPAPAPLPTPVPTPLPNNQPQFNIFISGGDTLKTTDHVASAVYLDHLPSLLHRYIGWPKGWYKNLPECQGKKGDGLSCDEYPFRTAVEGGPGNYTNKRVSLALVPGTEQDAQGGVLSAFYGQCGVVQSNNPNNPAQGSEFVVEVNFFRPTGYSCKNGIKK